MQHNCIRNKEASAKVFGIVHHCGAGAGMSYFGGTLVVAHIVEGSNNNTSAGTVTFVVAAVAEVGNNHLPSARTLAFPDMASETCSHKPSTFLVGISHNTRLPFRLVGEDLLSAAGRMGHSLEHGTVILCRIAVLQSIVRFLACNWADMPALPV